MKPKREQAEALLKLMAEDHKRRHLMPVNLKKLQPDRTKFILVTLGGPDFAPEKIAGIVDLAAELTFERLRTKAPFGDEATLREMLQIAMANGAYHLDLIPPPCDSCLDELDAYLAQGATLRSSAAAMH